MQVATAELPVEVLDERSWYRGKLPEETLLDCRIVLVESLAALGLSGVQISQVVGLSPKEVSRLRAMARERSRAEADSVETWVPEPVDVPELLPCPRPRRRDLQVSAKLMRRLRRDYEPGRFTDDGRELGLLPEVATWLANLKPERV